MTCRRPTILASFAVALAALGLALSPGRMVATDGCTVQVIVLGRTPRLTGPTDTDWFNVLGIGFDPSAPATITFGLQVIPWPEGALESVDATRSTESDGSFKWTFRARDVGVDRIDIAVTAGGCEATTIAHFAAPNTSVAETLPVEGGGLPPSSVVAVMVAAACGALAIRHRLREQIPR